MFSENRILSNLFFKTEEKSILAPKFTSAKHISNKVIQTTTSYIKSCKDIVSKLPEW
jgi:hypothetical protein